MATTYNNLYMDIRQTLRRAGIEAATLEARELMCFASGKTPQPAGAGWAAVCPPGHRGAGEGSGVPPSGGGAGGLPHRGVGVLRPAPGHLRRRADPPTGHGDAGGPRGHRVAAAPAGVPGVRPVRRLRAASVWPSPVRSPAHGWCWGSWTRGPCGSAARISAATVSAGRWCPCRWTLCPIRLPGWGILTVWCATPYIPSGDITGLDVSVRDYEPHLALDGGTDGLDFYRSVCRRWRDVLHTGSRLAFEVGIGQADDVLRLMRGEGLR